MKVKSESEVAQSCLTLCDPMDCSLPGSSIHGIFQARVLEWGAIAFSSSNPTPPLFSYVTLGELLCKWRRQWHLTLVLLPGKSHGQRSLVGCSPWGREESDTTEQLHFHTLEKEMATHSSVLAWRVPGMEEPGGLLAG